MNLNPENNGIPYLKKQYREYAQEILMPNLRKRLELRYAMSKSPELTAVQREIFYRDVLHAFDMFFWIKEPRPHYLAWYGLTNADLPFVLYPNQREYVLKLCDHIDSGKDILVDKSREQGATWITMCVLLWYWLKPTTGNDFLVGSRKEVNVDKKGAQDTLFAKLRYNIMRLPLEFIPEGYDLNKHDKVTLLTNPKTKSAINGEANNANFGTSGRYKAIFADEFSKWEDTDEAAYTSMGSSSPCRIIVSTPYGMGKKFSRLRFSDAIAIHTLHWSDHPLHGAGKYVVHEHPYLPDKKDVTISPWYIMECERRKENPEADIGQELDIDHLTSGTPYFKSQARYIQQRYKQLEIETHGERYDFLRQSNNEITLFKSETGRIVIRKEPVPGWSLRYCISADVAEGLEYGDNSAMYVYDRVTGEDVAWFVGKVDTHVFALLLQHFGIMYEYAYIAIERNNQGSAVIQALKYEYEYLYHMEDFGSYIDIETVRLGFHTNMQTKPIACGDLRKALGDGVDGVFDKDFFSECQTFVTHPRTGRLGASEHNRDDRVIAQAIKWRIHQWLDAPSQEIKYINPFEGMPRFGGIVDAVQRDHRTIWR